MRRAEQFKELVDRIKLLCDTVEMQLINFNDDIVPHLEAYIEGKLPVLAITTDELEKLDELGKDIKNYEFDKITMPLLHLLEPIRKACSIAYGIRKTNTGIKMETTKATGPKIKEPAKEPTLADSVKNLSPEDMKALAQFLKKT